MTGNDEGMRDGAGGSGKDPGAAGIGADGNVGKDERISSGGSGSVRTPPSGATDEGRDDP
mgnify:CR=1 FL=1